VPNVLIAMVECYQLHAQSIGELLVPSKATWIANRYSKVVCRGTLAVSTPRKANPQKLGCRPTWRDGNLEQAKKLAVPAANESPHRRR
jgi:hypothetical protein